MFRAVFYDSIGMLTLWHQSRMTGAIYVHECYIHLEDHRQSKYLHGTLDRTKIKKRFHPQLPKLKNSIAVLSISGSISSGFLAPFAAPRADLCASAL